MKKLIVFFLILIFAVAGYAQDTKGGSTDPIKELTANVSTSLAAIRAEAEQLGIPKSQVLRYVVEMRNINREYQSGSLTRTEYIAVKRNIIQRLK